MYSVYREYLNALRKESKETGKNLRDLEFNYFKQGQTLPKKGD
jgi:hypothetical protein